MLKVKLLGGRVGLGKDGLPYSQEPGAVLDVPRREARRMVLAGQAEPVGWKLDPEEG